MIIAKLIICLIALIVIKLMIDWKEESNTSFYSYLTYNRPNWFVSIIMLFSFSIVLFIKDYCGQ